MRVPERHPAVHTAHNSCRIAPSHIDGKWRSSCMPPLGRNVRLVQGKGNTMKNKAHAAHAILEMTEYRAQACQVPVHSPSARTQTPGSL